MHRMMQTLRSTPSHAWGRRICARAVRAIALRRRRRADLVQGTYLSSTQRPTLQAYWPQFDLPLAPPDLRALRETCAHYLQHRFDLLGSGWVTVRHGMHCRGLSGYCYEPGEPARHDPDGHWLQERIPAANLDASRQVWRLVDQDYTPIDWHLDFKSGYRWNESTWYRDIQFGETPGADIKAPWELARMQHLPRLACAHALAAAEAEGFQPAEVYAREFRNQVLDFIATNPPRFGVNWYSTMDVGIRVANWLLAYDWLRAAGARWDQAFEDQFADSILVHGRHILQNLDWNPTWRGNHYLANIVGLLFVAAYLPSNAVADAWLAFAVEQLIEEVRRQFADDGSNFEASTSYHRLSAEMVAYGTALVLALGTDRRSAFEHYDHRLILCRPHLKPAPLPRYALPGGRGDSPFPPWYFERLERMAEFTLHVTKPSLQIHQVGDNDSGRFLNLQPVYLRLTTAEAKARFENLAPYDELPEDATYWAEDHLDHRPLVAALGGLVDRGDFARFCGPDRIEMPLVRKWAGGSGLPSHVCAGGRPQAATARVGAEPQWHELHARLASHRGLRRHAWRICLPDAEILNDLELYAYPDFGLFLWRSRRLYLAVRCGPRVHGGHAAHAHNDQLAIELTIDGQDLLVDPGTYLYTPDPQQRNRYRSVAAHDAPQPIDGREPGRLDLNVFALRDAAKAQCLYFGSRGFAGTHQGYGLPIYRTIELETDAIAVTDYADRNMVLRETGLDRSDDRNDARLPFSAGYGIAAAQFQPRRE